MIRIRIVATGLLAVGSLVATTHEMRSSSSGTSSGRPTGYAIRKRHRATTTTTTAPVTTPAPTTAATTTPPTPTAAPTTRATAAPTTPATTAAPTTQATAAPTTPAPPTTRATTPPTLPPTTAPPAGSAVRGGGMPLVSRGVPAFASSGTDPAAATDASNTSTWSSGSIPAWLAYDLSGVPTASRQRTLVAIYAERSNDYDNSGQIGDWQQMPLDYTIETNTAPAGTPPTTGWTPLVTVTDNTLAAPQHLVELNGAPWLRVRVTRASHPTTVSLDVDVYSAPNGATDSWLFLGDSITSMTFQRLFQNPSLASQVNTRDPARWPAQIGGGIGGTNSTTALDIIDRRLAAFPGRYIVLAYGTNDGDPTTYRTNMTTLVNRIIAAGKTPVIPTVPWTSTRTLTTQLNTVINDLYTTYPQILRGPDLYTLTLNRTDYIPNGDVHPTDAGRAAIVTAYATII